MNKKIYLLLIILIIIFMLVLNLKFKSTYTLKSNSYEYNVSNEENAKEINLESCYKAIQEVAYSYYMRGKNIQYNSYKSSVSFYPPEEATNQNTNYTVCSAFVRNVYNELLGIKIPKDTASLLKYSRLNIERPEVIAYGAKNDSNDVILSFKNGENNEENPEIQNIISQLNIGDILTYTGHTILIYDILHDADGNAIEAVYIESGYGNGSYKVNTKIKNIENGGNIQLYHNSRTNRNFEYGLLEGSIHLEKLSRNVHWNFKDENKSKRANEYSILRFVTADEDGNILLNYNDDSNLDTTISFNNERIDLTPNTQERLKYSKLFIEKTVNVHADDIVEENEILTYSIIIKNNSNIDYTDDLIVTENVSEYADYIDKIYEYEFIKNGNELKWNIEKLSAGEEIKIEYSVKVKSNYNGKIIESSGKVGNIPSAIIKNTIGNNLNLSKSENIRTAYEELKNNYAGKELINEIYKKNGVDLKLEDFDITKLIKNTDISSKSSTSICLNNDNQFYDMVLNKYWSALLSLKENNTTEYNLKLWGEYTDKNRRADTIYSENFKTGDILIYTNKDDKRNKNTAYNTYENGEYAYIYIEGQGFVGINHGADGISGTNDDRNIFDSQYYIDNRLNVYSDTSVNDKSILDFMNYQTLFGKDYYVILRPALAVKSKYIVTWKNEDGSVIEETQVTYGEMPEYKGEIPRKETDAQYTYTFSGWTPEITEVTGDAIYTATYTAKTRWQELKEKIKNNEESDITLHLKQGTWIADSTITIPTGKTVTITAEKGITITRDNNFKEAFIINNGTLTIDGCDSNNKIVFDGNNVETQNRVIQVGESEKTGILNLSNVVIQNNKNKNATKNGGAICGFPNSKITLNSVEISNNESNGNYGGGAIYSNGELTIIDSIISNNTAQTYGGGIYGNSLSNITIENSIISNNISDNNGGGIYTKKGVLKVNDTEISKNIAGDAGGGIYWLGGKLEINGNNWAVSEIISGTETDRVFGDNSELQILKNNNIKDNIANANTTKNKTSGDYAGNNVYPYDWCTALDYETIDKSDFECIGKMDNVYQYTKDGDETTIKQRFIQQGMAANDDYILLGRIHKERDKNNNLVDGDGILTLISRKLLKEKENLEEAIIDNYMVGKIGHLNNLTYNEDTEKFYTANGKKLYEITIKEGKITISQDFINLGISLSGLTYYSDGKCFIGRSGKTLYKIPISIAEDENGVKNLEIAGASEKISDEYATLTAQDLEDYGGNLYYCWFEYGSTWQTKYYESGDRHLDSLIYVYDLEGILQKVLYMPKKLYEGWGEVEDVYIDKKTGEMIFAFSTDNWRTISLYNCNYLKKEENEEYNITYVLNGGSLVEGITNPETYTIETDTFTLNNPERAGYTFIGWTGSNGDEPQKEVTIAKGSTENREYVANWQINTYTITWKDENGEIIDTTRVAYGEMPTHEDVIKESDAEYTYTFSGWTPEITEVNKDTEYTATYVQTKNTYTITWKDENGEIIDTTRVAYGEMPTHEDVIKESNAEYTYTFSGWTPEITEVTKDTEYTATYAQTKNTYTITWKNENGEIIDTTRVAYGEMPTHEDVIKESDAEYTYTFSGWMPEITEVTKDAEYTATYTQTLIEKEKLEVSFETITPYKLNEESKTTYLRNIKTNTSIKDVISDITTNAEKIEIYIGEEKIDYTSEENKGKVIGTGNKVVITLGEETVEYIVVVKGDVTGDGQIDFINDIVAINNYRLGKSENVTEEEKLASDIDGNGIIDFIKDIVAINNYRLGKSNNL